MLKLYLTFPEIIKVLWDSRLMFSINKSGMTKIQTFHLLYAGHALNIRETFNVFLFTSSFKVLN